MVKNSPANAGDAEDVGSMPESGRCPGGGNGNPLQYSCLGNPMDRGAWRATVHEVAEPGGPPCMRLQSCAHDCAQHMHTQRRKFTKGRKEEMKGGRRRGAKEGLFPLLVQNPARSKK